MKDATAGKSGTNTAEIRLVEASEDQAGQSHGASGPKVGGVPDEDLSVTRRAIADLVRRAERGDLSVMPDLRRLLDDRPMLWKHCGDAARAAESAWVAVAGGTNLLARESLARQLAAMKAELAGPDAPPLERLLAERVAIGHLQVLQADGALAQAGGKALTVAQINLLVGRHEKAHRMYLAAIKALATVQKLVPTKAETVQVQAAAKLEKPAGVAGPVEPALTIAGETLGFGPEPGRKRRPKAAKPALAERAAATLPGAILDRIRGLVVTGEEN